MSVDNGRRSVSENASVHRGQILGFRFSVFVAIAACLACLVAALLVSGCSSGGSGSSSGSAGSKPTGSAATGSVPGTNVQTEAGGQIEFGILKPAIDYSDLVQVFIIKEFDVVE